VLSLYEYSFWFSWYFEDVERTSQDGNSQSPAGIVQKKWGEALSAGFQVVPNILIRDQNRLGLDALDVVILLNLTAHWWEQDNKPFISPALIGKRMNVTTRTVERHLRKLEDRQFIGRDPRGPKSGDGPYIRRYDLMPLAGVLKEASQNALTERMRRANEKGSSILNRKGQAVSETAAPKV
jgi:predicted transcriptional regulator